MLLVTADHGNAECMFDENGKVNTAHTTNLVPFTVCMNGIELNNGKLADIAPDSSDNGTQAAGGNDRRIAHQVSRPGQ